MLRLSPSNYSRPLLWVSCLMTLAIGQVALASSSEIYHCDDPDSGSHYMTNMKSSLPENCQNIQVMAVPTYQSQSSEDTGLRASEKAQLQRIENTEAQMRQVDEKVGLGVLGSWQDYRHNQCFAYRERVAEAQADRKDDVRLNRQIQRDLTQIDYYCR